MITGVKAETVAPSAGEMTSETGAVTSADAEAGTSPACSVAGCTPMSAKRFTVACCMSALGLAAMPSWTPSSPHDHCSVPEPNTSAPLGRRWKTACWVAVAPTRVESRTSPAGRAPLSRSSPHSRPRVPSGPVQAAPGARVATFGALRQKRIFPSASGTCTADWPPLTLKIVPVSAFSGLLCPLSRVAPRWLPKKAR